MKAFSISLVLVLLAIGSPSVYAGGGGSSGQTSGQHTSRYCDTCPRDAQGNIQRSDKAKDDFVKQNPLPEKCPTRADCVIDHVKPLGVGAREHQAPYLGTASIAAHAWCE
jgi:hypothetical protein